MARRFSPNSWIFCRGARSHGLSPGMVAISGCGAVLRRALSGPMAFAQLTYRESLRDIETCLSVQVSKLYSMGFRDRVGSGRAQKAVVNILWIEVCNGVHRVDRITPNLLSLGHRQRPEYCERRRVCKMRP